MVAVIIDLAVEWRPEAELGSHEDVAEQRQRIQDAQDEVVDLLDGTAFEVTRLYEATPQMAVIVDAEGLERLRSSDLVDKVSEDTPEPATG